MNGDDFFSTSELKVIIISALLAVFGGLAKLFMSQRQLTLSRFLSSSIVSGFSGVMASYLMQCTDLSPAFQSFVIGMSGFAAPTALSAFTVIYERKLGIKLDNARSKRKKREVR
ncbi:MAG TPA: phage holin family protein [Syntrophobacteraceae bacterium]|nr:phage holin family protein [Syntrophobacteraceae bacterium]